MNSPAVAPIEQAAQVVRLDPRGVWVEPVEPSGCGSCGGRCGARRLADLFSRRRRNFLVETRLSLQPGDRVIVSLPAGRVLTAAVWLYGMPLALMLAGAVLGRLAGADDGSAVAGLLAGGVLAALLGRGRPGAPPTVVRQETLLGIRKGH